LDRLFSCGAGFPKLFPKAEHFAAPSVGAVREPPGLRTLLEAPQPGKPAPKITDIGTRDAPLHRRMVASVFFAVAGSTAV